MLDPNLKSWERIGVTILGVTCFALAVLGDFNSGWLRLPLILVGIVFFHAAIGGW